MAKVNQAFKHDAYRFVHKPIRTKDQDEGFQFLERYMYGAQRQFENVFGKIDSLPNLYDPAKTPQPRYLKDIVGFTKELDNITNDITDDDLRKLIGLAVALWKQKGLELGYLNIVRLFTGKNSRVFNWFDFRFIVGEQAFGEEQLGEDAWIISMPGVYGSDPTINVLLYLPFEQNFLDRSVFANEFEVHNVDYQFHLTGPVSGSEHYVTLYGSVLTAQCTGQFDFSGDFTIEGYFKTNTAMDGVVWKKWDAGSGAGVELRYDSNLNEIRYTLSDGTNTVTETLAAAADLDDSTFRHLALVVDRTEGVSRLYLNGTEATPGAALGALGDVTAPGHDVFIAGAEDFASNIYYGSMDNIRVSKSAQYDVTSATLPVPAVTFIPYQAEQLDEFFTDVRVVDEGDLNRTLTKRILNLMRPISERLRVIYIRYFENFSSGKGALLTASPGSYVQDEELQMPAGAIEIGTGVDAENYQDIYLQIRVKVTTGGRFGVRFFQQDTNNYYEFIMDTQLKQCELVKKVAGVESALASPVPIEIFNDTFYILTVSTDYDSGLGTSELKCMLDQNVMFELNDSTFEKGPWGIESFAGGYAVVSDIEMFLKPLETEIIEPNAEF